MERRWFGSELMAWAMEELGIKTTTTWPKDKVSPREVLDAMRTHSNPFDVREPATIEFDAKRRARAVELIKFFELPIDPTAATDEQLERAVLMELQAMILRDQVRNRVKQEEPK